MIIDSAKSGKEIYLEYYRPIWRARKRAQRNGECRCPKAELWRCDGVCPGCEYYNPRTTVSLDAPFAGSDDELTLGDMLIGSEASMDAALIQNELFHRLNEALAHLTAEERSILFLIAEHRSIRQVAGILGIPESTLRGRWSKLQKKLQEKLISYK